MAVDWVRDTINREHIDCDWQEVPTVLFATDEKDEKHLRKLRAEREACRGVGWHDVVQEAWGFVAPQHNGGRSDKAGGVGDAGMGGNRHAVPVNQCLVFPNGSGQLDPIKVGWATPTTR